VLSFSGRTPALYRLNFRNLRPLPVLQYVMSTDSGRMILKRSASKNTRRSPRQWLNTSVQVFAESTAIDAMGINVGDGGMCLFTVANLPVGSQIEVEFVPPRARRRIRRLATIRHRAVYLYGLEWLPESDQPRDAWAETEVRQRQHAPTS
jgi:hypothetical protein